MPAGSSRPPSSRDLAVWACLWFIACSGGADHAGAAVTAPSPEAGDSLRADIIAASPGFGSPGATPQPPATPATMPATAASAQQTGDIWLNTSRAGELQRSQIARAADGSYIAVRDDRVAGQSSANAAVFVRRLDGAGNPVGAETLVGPGTAPGVAAFADGTFLVTWLAPPPVTFSLTVSVNGQLFDSSGNAAGAPMSLGETAGHARPTALADGSFVLATFGNFSRVSGPSGFLRTYTRTGAEAGFVAELHEDACGIQGPPAVSALHTGGFAVAWPHACVSAPQVRMRAYDANGTLSTSSRMTVAAQGETVRVGLAPLTNGNLVLEWTAGTSPLRELRTLVVAPTALPQSPAGAAMVQLQPGRTPLPVQALSGGGFVIPWSASNASEARVPVSRFSNTGEPL